jgi:hypothetical protein
LPVRARTDPAAAVRVLRELPATGGHPVQVACGELGGGLDGFRRTHRQAVAAHAVAGSDDSRPVSAPMIRP